MDINVFLKNFAEQFDDVKVDELAPNTKFRELEEWTSLTALAIIAMIDEEYGVTIVGEEMTASFTIADLFQIVKNKKN